MFARLTWENWTFIKLWNIIWIWLDFLCRARLLLENGYSPPLFHRTLRGERWERPEMALEGAPPRRSAVGRRSCPLRWPEIRVQHPRWRIDAILMNFSEYISRISQKFCQITAKFIHTSVIRSILWSSPRAKESREILKNLVGISAKSLTFLTRNRAML